MMSFRWTHKPGGDVRVVLGSESVVDKSGDVHGGSVLGRNLRRGIGESIPEVVLQPVRRRSQLAGRGVQHRRGFGCRDHRHLCFGVHRFLGHRP